MVLTSPGVEVTVNPGGIYAQPNPTTIPLAVIATRGNKISADGTGTAPGTIEHNKLRLLTNQRDLKQNYGLPVFVTSAGDPVHGDETNEYGLLALHSYLGQGNRAFVIRADIDLDQIMPSTIEPFLLPPDGTYWIESDTVIGGVFTMISGVWTAVPFSVYLTAPAGGDGSDGDFAFDYSTANGTMKLKFSGTWLAATTANLITAGATDPMFVSATTPVGAVDGDYWYKTSASGGGVNLMLSKFRASDSAWILQPITYSVTTPVTPTQDLIWEDLSAFASTGARPLRIGTGATFIALTYFVQADPPTSAPATGTYWFDDTITDFAMYQESGNVWVPILTTTVSNPTSTEKVISASPPEFPSVDAIWIDVSSTLNLDNFPVVKRWNGSQWIDITSNIAITDVDPVATLVPNGTYWINTGEALTRNTIKQYNPVYVAHTVDGGGAVVVEADNFWQPIVGKTFGRKAQRKIVVEKLQAAFVDNDFIRAESIYFQLIACPGYPELYDEMVELNTDNKEVSFIVADTPKFMIPSGIPTGREITVAEWATNTNNVETVGEDGFSGAPTPYAAFYYPWGLATNTDGLNVFVPPSHMVLRAYAYSDSVSAPWFAPAGFARGRVDNAGSVGFLDDDGLYQPLLLGRPQRDVIYENKINPIASIPNRGLIIFGQKTMQATAGALDRVNVARLIAKMKYDLQRLLEPFLFEINDPITRRSAQIVTERYLAGLKSLRALYDYAARCDESNNTADRIDRNELWVDVAVKPAKAIEFIYVPITVLGTGDELPS